MFNIRYPFLYICYCVFFVDVEVLAEELFLDEPLGYGSSVSVEDSCSFTYSSTSNMSPARTLFIMADAFLISSA